MHPSPVLELNAFVPAKDFNVSKQFYSDIGFELAWGNDEIAKFQIGSFSFLLQDFHVQQHAENFMMSLVVEDADRWWEHFERIGLREKYPRASCSSRPRCSLGAFAFYISRIPRVCCGTSRTERMHNAIHATCEDARA